MKKFILFCLLLPVLTPAEIMAQADQLLKLTMDYFSNYNPTAGLKDRYYIPSEIKPGLTPEKAKKDIARLLDKYCISRDSKENNEYAYYNDSTKVKGNRIKEDPIVVTDDYIEFNTTQEGLVRINFRDILFDEIVHVGMNGVNTCLLTVGKHNFSICIFDFPDALYYMQYMYGIKYFNEQVEAFRPVAEEYLKTSDKPEMTEEQHRYFVQGNALAQTRQAKKAIQLYNKAIAINPVTYPEGYYNLALIASLVNYYPFAVCCMKKYLMLVPDAEDARDAQDKIYGWEIQYADKM